MAQEKYVKHVLSTLSSQTREDLQAHLNYLDAILDQIDSVPSPEKESLLVDLILRGQAKPARQDDAQPSA